MSFWRKATVSILVGRSGVAVSKLNGANLTRMPSERRSYSAQRGPRASTFRPSPTRKHSPDRDEQGTQNLTRLRDDAPTHLKRQALEMYESCRLSSRDAVTRFAIVRQMRNLDLPPHREAWQVIQPADELQLYRWINEAFGQLLYAKKLWKPSLDWRAEDDECERELELENYRLLQGAYQEQIVDPLKKTFGDDEVTIALSNLAEDQRLYVKPAIIWRSARAGDETSLEWMSEVTADVAWPGLVSCQPEHQVARRHWELEARKFAQTMGGTPRGMGPDGETLANDEETSEGPSGIHHHHQPDPFPLHPSLPHQSTQEHRRLAEAVLVKQFLQDRQSSSSCK